jgi:hypothetical protein
MIDVEKIQVRYPEITLDAVAGLITAVDHDCWEYPSFSLESWNRSLSKGNTDEALTKHRQATPG